MAHARTMVMTAVKHLMLLALRGPQAVHLVTRAGKRKQRRSQYLSEDRLASVMDTFIHKPAQRSVSPARVCTPPVDPLPQPDTIKAPPAPQPPVPPSVKSGVPSPSPSPVQDSRPLLDPFEPLFEVKDDEDAKALEEIEGMIQLILDVTPRKLEGLRKRRKPEGREV